MRTLTLKEGVMSWDVRSPPLHFFPLFIHTRRICAIWGKLNVNGSPHQIKPEDMAADPGVRYNMGISQKFPVHM